MTGRKEVRAEYARATPDALIAEARRLRESAPDGALSANAELLLRTDELGRAMLARMRSDPDGWKAAVERAKSP